jgi:pyruvate dehydrogenase E1 component alpha subunit
VENNIHKVAEPFCVPACEVDGNDVLKVFAAGRMAIDRGRKGLGPTFIECLTYRFRGHVGPDDNIQGDHTDIRPPEEVERWFQKDPIKRFEDYLLSNRLVNREILADISHQAEKEVAEAHIFAKKSMLPERKDLARYVYK